MTSRNVFITGGTGYLGRRLIPELLKRGHTVRALVRQGSEAKLPPGCASVTGDPLDKESFAPQISPADTFVQLVGVPKPSPAKAAQFRAIDLVSIQQSVPAAVAAGIAHFVYVSVAHPAPMMKAYIEVRSEGERLIRESGLRATILRPWYVLGPDHRWPYLLVPAYKMFEMLPSTRDSAQRLGLVTLRQMINALLNAVENPSDNHHIVEVPEIRRL
ncbi:MAG: hypothetical protein V7641_4743 [Blastocatellia bacterium]